jgi:uncharacterized repeat protein (TIGR03803 family)
MKRLVNLGKLTRGKWGTAILVLCTTTAIVLAAHAPVWAVTFKTVYNFCSQTGCTDGELPEAAVIQATNGNLYGTTAYGRAISYLYGFGSGTVFKIDPYIGKLTTLYSFCSGDCADGAGPTGLVQTTDGNFYGTTVYAGANDYGTIFKINPYSGTETTLYTFCSEGAYPYCTDGAYPTGDWCRSPMGISVGQRAKAEATPMARSFASIRIMSS